MIKKDELKNITINRQRQAVNTVNSALPQIGSIESVAVESLERFTGRLTRLPDNPASFSTSKITELPPSINSIGELNLDRSTVTSSQQLDQLVANLSHLEGQLSKTIRSMEDIDSLREMNPSLI